MEQLRDGIKQDIIVILNELIANRKAGETSAYKSLTDSLEKLFRLLNESGTLDVDFNYYSCLAKDIKIEISETRTYANKLMEQKDYQNYRHWIESFKRLILLHNSIIAR